MDKKRQASKFIEIPSSMESLYCRLKALAQCQILLGAVCSAFGGLYFFHHGATRVLAAGIWAGTYFILTGFMGVCGTASHRRGLITTYLVMCLHAAVIFCPGLILTSSIGCLADKWGCDWKCTTKPFFQCEFQCGDANNWEEVENARGRIVDICLICLAIAELVIAITSTVLCAKTTCDHWGLIDKEILSRIAFITAKNDDHSVAETENTNTEETASLQ